jgi:hypothetical protein
MGALVPWSRHPGPVAVAAMLTFRQGAAVLWACSRVTDLRLLALRADARTPRWPAGTSMRFAADPRASDHVGGPASIRRHLPRPGACGLDRSTVVVERGTSTFDFRPQRRHRLGSTRPPRRLGGGVACPGESAKRAVRPFHVGMPRPRARNR